jgi:hypothetical protein
MHSTWAQLNDQLKPQMYYTFVESVHSGTVGKEEAALTLQVSFR